MELLGSGELQPKINSIQYLLCKHIEGFKDIHLAAQERCCSYVLAYLFHTSSFGEMQKKIRMEVGRSVSLDRFRAALLSNGYILKHVKSWIFHCYKTGFVRNSADNRYIQLSHSYVMAEFGVVTCDFSLLYMIDSKTDRELKRLSGKYKCLKPAALDAAISRITETIRVWIRKFVYRKMAFIIRSHAIAMEDMEYELIGKGISALLLRNPFIESWAHAVNFCKRVIHNHGINLINKYTHKKRARILQNEDLTFYTNTLSIDTAKEILDNDPEWIRDEIERQESRDLTLDIQALIRSVPEKFRRLLQLLQGFADIDFTQWLFRRGKIKRGETNEELQDRIDPWDYINLALRFLGINPNAGLVFICRMRKLLAPYRNALA